MEIQQENLGRSGYKRPVSAIFLTLTLLFACGCDNRPTAPDSPRAPVSPAAPTSSNETDDPNMPNAQIQGTYAVSFMASPDCTLPVEVRSRTYVATVSQTPASSSDIVEVVLSGADFWQDPVLGVLNRFSGTVLDDDVTFLFGDRGIAEEISPGELLVIEGGTSGSAGSSSIAGPLRGGFTYGEDPWGDHDPFGHAGCAGGSVTFIRQ